MISIIVPVYKVESYLDRCVESILTQTYRDFELLLVDDGSPDRCGEMCETWAAKDPRIRVFHKSNGGLSDARNYGLDLMRGKFVTFVDSDDYVMPDYLEYLISLFDKEPTAKYVECGFYTKRGEGMTPSDDCERLKVMDRIEALQQTLYHQGPDIAAWAKMYRREVFDKLRFPSGRVFEEIAVVGDYRAMSAKVVYSGKPLYVYEVRDQSITTAAFRESSCRDHVAASEHFSNMALSVSESLRPACRRFMAYSRMRCLRTMKAIEMSSTGLYEWKRELRRLVLKDALPLLFDRNVPRRDKIGIIFLACGMRFYHWAWDVYGKIRK